MTKIQIQTPMKTTYLQATLDSATKIVRDSKGSVGHFLNWISGPDINPKAVRHNYKDDQWKDRMNWIQQNGKYAEKPELFKLDQIVDNGKKKFVCIACKRVGHTADKCREAATQYRCTGTEIPVCMYGGYRTSVYVRTMMR